MLKYRVINRMFSKLVKKVIVIFHCSVFLEDENVVNALVNCEIVVKIRKWLFYWCHITPVPLTNVVDFQD